MKSKFFLFLALSLVILTGCPPSAPPCIEILHISLDGNTFDTSIYRHPVKPSGTLHYGQDRFAEINKALIFDGSTALSIPDTTTIHFSNASSFTISTWIRTRDTDDATIVGKGPANNAVPGYQLRLVHGHPNATITATGKNVDLTGANSVADNVWHLLTLTATPTEVKLYLDTTIVGHATNVHLVPDSLNTDSLRIGRSPDGLRYYNGYLDEIIIRPCPETQAEISNGWGRSLSIATLADMPPGVRNSPTGQDQTVLFSPTVFMLGMCSVPGQAGAVYCCGTHSTIATGTPGSPGWNIYQMTGIGNTHIFRCVSFADANHGILVSDDNTIYIWNGTSWILATPNYASILQTNDAHISDVKYIDPGHAILVGSTFIGYGFMLAMNTSDFTTSSISPLNSWGPMHCIGTAQEGNGTSLWSFGEDGEIWNCTFDPSSILNTQNSLHSQSVTDPALPGTSFRSCDLIAYSGTTFGLAGTDNGRIYEYAGVSWVLSQQGATSPWIAGIHINSETPIDVVAISDWTNGTGYGGSVIKRTSSGWSNSSFVSSQNGYLGWICLTATAPGQIQFLPYPSTPAGGTNIPIDVDIAPY